MITPTPFPTSTAAPLPTPYPTIAPNPTGTAMPVPTDTPLPTLAPNPTSTGAPVPTDTPLPTLAPNPTGTAMPVPTDTPLPTLPPPPTLPPAPTLAPIPVQQFVWGQNQAGQLGIGDNKNKTSPVPLGLPGEYAQIQFSDTNGAFLKYDGSLWMTGLNNEGQLGINYQSRNASNSMSSPVQEITSSDWMSFDLSPSSNYVLAVRDDGALCAWGAVPGFTSASGTLKATKVTSDDGYAKCAAGNYGGYAVKSDGSLWSFGGNTYGLLGVYTSGNIPPVYANSGLQQIMSGSTDWSAVYAGSKNVYALKTDGSLYGWGMNNYGQLGDGTVIGKSTPVQIGSGMTWSSLTPLQDAAIAVTSGGEVYGWGVNNYGDLANNATSVKYSSPVQIYSGSCEFASCANMTTAVISSGSLMTCGYNGFGELATSGIRFRTSLAPVSSDNSWIGLQNGGGNSMGAFAVLPTATPSPTYYPVPTATPPVFLMIPFNFNFETVSMYPLDEGFTFENAEVYDDMLKLQYISNDTTVTQYSVEVENLSEISVFVNLGNDTYEMGPASSEVYTLNLKFGDIVSVYCQGNVTLMPGLITGQIVKI